MKIIKVSIVIPVYNAEKYLEECIESALNQTYPDIEVIAVNDGSTDNSLGILKKYEGKIKIISKENGGVASALNAGINAMTGEWFKWLSADDALYPTAVEELISEAKKIEDKKHTILYSHFDFIDSEGKLVDHAIEPNYNDLDSFDFNVILLDHLVGNGTTSLVHKSTIDDYGMFKEKIDFEDYELWLRYCILHNSRLLLVPKTLAKYRIHEGQLTKEKLKKGIEVRDALRESILKKLDTKERIKYENALKQYKKNKPIIEKGKYFVRYKLFRFLPTSISKCLIDAYWYARKKKR